MEVRQIIQRVHYLSSTSYMLLVEAPDTILGQEFVVSTPEGTRCVEERAQFEVGMVR